MPELDVTAAAGQQVYVPVCLHPPQPSLSPCYNSQMPLLVNLDPYAYIPMYVHQLMCVGLGLRQLLQHLPNCVRITYIPI